MSHIFYLVNWIILSSVMQLSGLYFIFILFFFPQHHAGYGVEYYTGSSELLMYTRFVYFLVVR